MEKDDILLDFTIRVIVDDVSSEPEARTEFRASVWGENDLLGEGWGSSITEALHNGVKEWLENE